MSDIDNSDYYQLLNVPRNATAADIKNSYLKLCLSFHPDKQRDDTLREASQRVFNIIHTAYTVLSNPKQREIYDKFGAEGIEVAWQLGPHLSETSKLLEEIERRKLKGGLFNGEFNLAKSTLTLALDVSEIVEDVVEAESLVYSDFLPKVSTVGLSQVFETSIDNENLLTLTTTAFGQHGNLGNGSCIINWKRPLLFPSVANNSRHLLHPLFDRLGFDGQVGFGSKKFVSTAFICPIDTTTTASLQLAASLHGGSYFPQLNFSLSKLVQEKFSCSLQYSVFQGVEADISNRIIASVSTKVSPETKNPWTATAIIDSQSPAVELKKAFSFSEANEVRVKADAKMDWSSGVSIGIHHKWSSEARASMALQLDSNTGIGLRFGVTKSHFHFILPIQFAHEFSPVALFAASAIPALGTFIARNWIHPYILKRQKELFWDDFVRRRAALLEKRREEAQLTQQLMAAFIEKRGMAVNAELKIVEAVYRSCTHNELQLNVTYPLQYMLLQSPEHLQLAAAYRASVLGFFDISPGTEKELFIRYEFKGKPHEATFKDDETVIIPKKSHMI